MNIIGLPIAIGNTMHTISALCFFGKTLTTQ
jgi:hypothetical protein